MIPAQCAGLRLDQAMAKLVPEFSRSRLQNWIKNEQITLDGAAAAIKQKVWGGEAVLISPLPNPEETAFKAEDIALSIVFEDDTILVIDKPATLVVHPGAGNWEGTLLNALLHHAPQLAQIPRAGIVHRLDKETSGLLVVAKTLEAQTDLVRQLQSRTVKRQYFALVHGAPPDSGTVDAPIGRHPRKRTHMAVLQSGKPARTHFLTLRRYDGCALVECSLETGRTHQIRVHMQHIRHPLVGDPVYGTHPRASKNRERLAAFGRQALHAARLGLLHPKSHELMNFEAPIPADLAQLLSELE